MKSKTETGFIIAEFAAGGISEKFLLFVKKLFFKSFYESSTMGNKLSKEQEQCFRLIQQLFKAAGCLPDKRSLDLKIRGKAGQSSPHSWEKLGQKEEGADACQLGPFCSSLQLQQATQPRPVSSAGV